MHIDTRCVRALSARPAARKVPNLFTLKRWSSSVADASAGAGDAAGAEAAAKAARNRRLVGIWIATTAGAVFAMVVLGGVTRLTRSGLSIVEWRPEGEKLPSTDSEWEVEFRKYRDFPEYQRVNAHMSLDEFKPIYFMEWAHRQWGRVIGLLFAGPLVYFAAARRIPPGLGPRLGLLLALGGAQGGVGWWMVKSGLEHERFGEHSIPRVSPYRLATHVSGPLDSCCIMMMTMLFGFARREPDQEIGKLFPAVSHNSHYVNPSRFPPPLTLPQPLGPPLNPQLTFAFSLYSALAWTALDLLRTPPPALARPAKAATAALRPTALAAAGTIFLTVASGAFVAGNDAGHAYNDWPLFAGRVIPEQIWEASLGFRNFFENTATVQFDHRTLAYASLAAVGAVHMRAARLPGKSASLPPAVRSAARLLGGLVGAQVLLGISTLMLYVPVPLAAVHQAGALALLTGALNLLHSIKQARGAPLVAGEGASVVKAAAAAAPKPAAATVAAAALLLCAGPSLSDRDDDDGERLRR